MSAGPGDRPVLLVVGGCTGLVGRAVLREFAATHRIRSLHRHPNDQERAAGVDPRPVDASEVSDWRTHLEGVDTVLTLAWYRPPRGARFARLAEGLLRLVRDAERVGVRRFVHVSVPNAPPKLEAGLPYLTEKRRVDHAVESSRLAYTIVRPTMLFGPGDVLLTVMLRTIHRYHRFPMFGDGEYHLSPISTADLASILRLEGERGARRNLPVGGPRRWRYRDLTDALFQAEGLPPKYFALSPSNSVRLARLLELFGSSLLYAYEVEWLLSDLLGLPPYVGLDRPLAPLEDFLRQQARRPPGATGEAAG